MALKMSAKDLVARADKVIKALTPAEVEAKLNDEGVLLIDIRDIREVTREGRIAGSVHMPRGVLEFWFDPESPYYRPEVGDAREIILHCNKGWRSALSAWTLQEEMGFDNISHMRGGFTRWVEDIGKVEKSDS